MDVVQKAVADHRTVPQFMQEDSVKEVSAQSGRQIYHMVLRIGRGDGPRVRPIDKSRVIWLYEADFPEISVHSKGIHCFR